MAISAITPLHQHDEHCGCGHHGVGADLAQGDWKTRLGVILAIGARPCSGAIMILMFSNALGIVTGNGRGNDHVAGNRAVDYGAIAGRALRPRAHGRGLAAAPR